MALAVMISLICATTASAATPPVLGTLETAPLVYTEGTAAVRITASVTVTDADSVNLASGSVQVVPFHPGEDVLSYAKVGKITGHFDASTGVLSLSGSDTVANYQAALRAVSFRDARQFPNLDQRYLYLAVNDGQNPSPLVWRPLTVQPLDQPPVLSGIESATLTFTKGSPAQKITSTLVVSDPDSTSLASASVTLGWNFVATEDVLTFTPVGHITGTYHPATGDLQLSGTDTLANYQIALRSVAYRNTAAYPQAVYRQANFQVSGTHYSSNSAYRYIALATPTLANAEADALAYTEGAPAVPCTATLTVTDPESATLASASVELGAFLSTEDALTYTKVGKINGTFEVANGVMRLTGVDTVANYQAAFRAVKFHTIKPNPTALTPYLVFNANDGHYQAGSVFRQIVVTPLHTPSLAGIEQTALACTGGSPPVALTATLVVTETGNTNLASASITLSGFQAGEDVLTFTPTPKITGSFDGSSGVLTLTGSDTPANYQAALRAVKYQDTHFAPGANFRTAAFQVFDGHYLSNVQTRPVTVAPVASFAVKINFQPAGTPLFPGFLADTSLPFGYRGNGYDYGWNLPFNETRIRNSATSPDLRYDTFEHMQKPSNPDARWEIAVPNGTYQVRVVSGDPLNTDSVYKVAVEGVLLVNGVPKATPAAAHWIDSGYQTVTVTDGRLTVTNAPGSVNNKIDFIEILQAPVGTASLGRWYRAAD